MIHVITYEESLNMIDVQTSILYNNFTKTYIDYLEDLENIHSNRLFTEKHKTTFSDALKVFIVGLITAIKDLKSSIQMEINRRLFSAEYKYKLNELKTKAQIAANSHQKTIKMVDYEAVCSTYVQMVDEVCKKAKKIADIKYLTVNGLDKDIAEFNNIVDAYDKKLEELMGTEKEYPIQSVISFIESEQRNGRIINTLDKAQKEFNEMKLGVERIENKEELVGKELLTKKVSIIRSSSNSLFKIIRKWIARLISKIVFYFA